MKNSRLPMKRENILIRSAMYCWSMDKRVSMKPCMEFVQQVKPARICQRYRPFCLFRLKIGIQTCGLLVLQEFFESYHRRGLCGWSSKNSLCRCCQHNCYL
ncbi:hypothetical protein Plhal304r1_c041g0119411 [Plasmopara halstedii]